MAPKMAMKMPLKMAHKKVLKLAYYQNTSWWPTDPRWGGVENIVQGNNSSSSRSSRTLNILLQIVSIVFTSCWGKQEHEESSGLINRPTK